MDLQRVCQWNAQLLSNLQHAEGQRTNPTVRRSYYVQILVSYFLCNVHCHIIMQHKRRKCTLLKLIRNSIFQLLTSSTCFEPHVFILRKTAVKGVFVWYIYMHWLKQSSRWKSAFGLITPVCANKPYKSALTTVLLRMNPWGSKHVDDVKN